MRDLIAKLEAATGPDRELDAEIYIALTPGCVSVERPPLDGLIHSDTAGWLFRWETPFPWHARWQPVPCYTTSLDAALTLVPEASDWSVQVKNGRPLAAVTNPKSKIADVLFGRAFNPAITLCITALRARMEDDND